MNDAYGDELEVGTRIVYSSGRVPVFGVVYVIGRVKELRPATETAPDKVVVDVERINHGPMPTKDPIVHASNVVRFE
jgi:hypothetical protein